jgi:magnesium chelatase family protein
MNTSAKPADCEYTCPCGYYQDPVKACTCSAVTTIKYQKRISGSLLDHLDFQALHVEYE